MRTVHRRVLAGVVLASCLLAGNASGQSSWAIAARDDAAIRAFVERLLPYAEQIAPDDGAAVLYRHATLNHEEHIRLCSNMVVALGEREALPEHIARPLVAYGSVDGAYAFVLRGDEVLRAPAQAVFDDRLDTRAHIAIEWPALRPGDVIGMSVVSQLRDDDELLEFAIDDVLPTVITGVSTNCVGEDQELAYTVRALDVRSSDVAFKDSDFVNGRAQRIKATLKQRPATDVAPVAPPFAEDVPRFLVARDADYYDIRYRRSVSADRGWNETMSWFDGAVRLSRFIRAWSRTSEIRSLADELALADLDLADALVRAGEYVNERFEVPDEPGTPRDLVRELDDLFETQSATARETVLLTAAIVRASGFWPRFGIHREHTLGEIPDGIEYWRLLNGTVLMLDGTPMVGPRGKPATGATDLQTVTAPVLVVDTEGMEVFAIAWDALEALRHGVRDLNLKTEYRSQLYDALVADKPDDAMVWEDLEVLATN